MRIELRRASSLRARIRHDLEYPVRFQLLLRDATSSRVPYSVPVWEREPKTEPVHGIRGIAPGHYQLEVCVEGDETPLRTIAGLNAIAGHPVRDARLDCIDLRAQLATLRIRVMDVQGSSILDPGGLVSIPGRSQGRDRTAPIIDGACTLAVRALPKSLTVSVPGFVAREVRDVRPDMAISLWSH